MGEKAYGRDNLKDVVLRDRLRIKLIDLNPNIPSSSIEYAVHELCKSRATLTPVMANKEVYGLIKEGFPIVYKNNDEREENDYIKVIDFENPKNNDFLIVFINLNLPRLKC